MYRRFFSTATAAVPKSSEKWDIVTAVCLERLPLVTPPLSALQQKYKQLLDKVEIEKSHKSDHEIRHEQDKIYFEKLKSDTSNIDLDMASKITAQDFEDAATEKLSKFKLAPIDQGTDVKSTKRKLQSHLVLLVRQKLGKEQIYALPQGKLCDGETLRQTAERVLKEKCGNDIEALFYGNAPCGYYKYKYPPSESEALGAKVFYYYARILSGNVTKEADFKWLDRNELKTSLPLNYYKSINAFLVDEE